jgi:four helix bundle protein
MPEFGYIEALHKSGAGVGVGENTSEMGSVAVAEIFASSASCPASVFSNFKSQSSDFKNPISNFKSPHNMPTYQRFEDLPVWQAAAALFDGVDDFLDAAPPRLSRSFRDQWERATLSISNNIAEGFERGTTSELLAFLYIARGSAGEVRSMSILLSRRPWLASNLKARVSDLSSGAEACSRQLRAWADSLQNSDIAGQRHLNEKSRADYQKRTARKQGAANFKALLAQHLPPDHPARQI